MTRLPPVTVLKERFSSSRRTMPCICPALFCGRAWTLHPLLQVAKCHGLIHYADGLQLSVI